MNSRLGNAFFDELAAEHGAWLSAFDQQYLVNWHRLLNANEEAALAEAGVRRLLQHHDATVQPNEDLTGRERRPDFHCELRGSGFDVEVTSISIAKATEVTGLAEDLTGANWYSSLNGAIFNACKGKAKQCAAAHHPTLLAVATFHYTASAICFGKAHAAALMTGETKMTWDLDIYTGRKVGDVYESTDLWPAVFLLPDRSEEVGFARSPISALLLCGLGACSRDVHGIWKPEVVGLLHPKPARPFDPTLLRGIEFGRVEIDRASRQLNVAWPDTESIGGTVAPA